MSNMDRKRRYSGQPHTSFGKRGKTKVVGLTMRDICDCYVRGVLSCTGDISPEKYTEAIKGEKANLSCNDLFGFDLDKIDPMAAMQNMTCEIEKMMGIYPNVPKLEYDAISEKCGLSINGKCTGNFSPLRCDGLNVPKECEKMLNVKSELSEVKE